jgi:hypothetical protein
MMARYYVRQNNKTVGPVTQEKILEGHRNNKLHRDALISCDEQKTWQHVREVISTLESKGSNPSHSNGDLPQTPLIYEKASPLAWYRAVLGQHWILTQVFLWVFYGFIWIPAWWLVFGRRMTKSKAMELTSLSNGWTTWQWDDNAILTGEAPPAWYPKDNGWIWVYSDRLVVTMRFIPIWKLQTVVFRDIRRVVEFTTQFLGMPVRYLCIETREGVFCCQHGLGRGGRWLGLWSGEHRLAAEEIAVDFKYSETVKGIAMKALGG